MSLQFFIAIAGAVMGAASLVLHAIGAKNATAEKIADEVDAAGKLLPKL